MNFRTKRLLSYVSVYRSIYCFCVCKIVKFENFMKKVHKVHTFPYLRNGKYVVLINLYFTHAKYEVIARIFHTKMNQKRRKLQTKIKMLFLGAINHLRT